MNLQAAVDLHCDSPKQASIRVHGLPITIEYPRGTLRELKNGAGQTVYRKHMFAHYGYIRGTRGRDGDGVDCFVGPLGDKATEVYVVHMKDLGPDKDQREDEDKCMLGYPSAEAAKQAFLLHYPSTFFESMTTMPVALFKKKMHQASLPYRHKKIHAGEPSELAMMRKAISRIFASCPMCGSTKHGGRLPTDFESVKCGGCGKVYSVGACCKK